MARQRRGGRSQQETGGADRSPPLCYGIHGSPFGRCLIAATSRGVCGLHFLEDEAGAIARVRHDWPRAELRRDPRGTAPLVERIFQPISPWSPQPLALLVKGTNFQMKVWRALLALPFGSITSYQAIADKIGQPRAARAVGGAVGANAIAYLIPCHRVIRDSGALGSYRWGEERKAMMLGWEAVRSI